MTVPSAIGQKLEEAAANAAEEERRLLQTQTEQQDRYRVDLEREKMVPAYTQSSDQKRLFRLWPAN
jgi:hypothetical protein